ncbi:hypothetical protein [Streptomyces sp. NPDC002088]|uniref:hypothetical protein n=1 Tax=Streptomyces sp. NPDC002088 TaxID=3154665 RepID=UPI0033237F3D
MHEQVDVVVLAVELLQFGLEVLADLPYGLLTPILLSTGAPYAPSLTTAVPACAPAARSSKD